MKLKVSRIIKLFFICSNFLIIGAVFGFGDNKTAYYEPAQVELTGIVNEMLFPGPPNYNSIDNGDVAEYGWYITLDEAVDVKVPNNAGKDTNDMPEDNISLIQIVDGNKKHWKKYKKGNHIKVTGSLFHAIFGHHHASVLIKVKNVELD
jgi:hypothetical protein